MQSPTKTLAEIFGTDRRLTVPLFQRRYVWTRERQWDRLWDDIIAVADAFVACAGDEDKERAVKPHFLGAVVLDGASQSMDDVQLWQIIDGQQRLTTSQLMLEAFSDLCRELGQLPYHQNMLKLTRIDNALNTDPDAVFKLWPTTADQEHFRNVMEVRNAAELCRRYAVEETAEAVNDALADGYLFFYRRMEEWLRPQEEALEGRIVALYKTLRKGLRFVTIELDERDDAQVIFETLNAHGTPLLVADLVKNFLFHKVRAGKDDLQKLYARYWQHFDDDRDFWSHVTGRGAAARETIDVFLQHYLVARTRRDVQVGHLFRAFREFAQGGRASDARTHLAELLTYSQAYKKLRQAPADSREGEFLERLDQMEVGPVYPFVLELMVNPAISAAERLQCMVDIESFLVRRMVCGLTTKHYNRLFVDAMPLIGDGPGVAQRLREYLLSGDGDAVRWPQLADFAVAWNRYPLYRKPGPKRVVVLLTAIERAMYDEKSEVVVHTKPLQVEHLMPRKWRKHWPLPEKANAEEEREDLIHTIGNLTLVTKKLNVKNSNLPWEKKRNLINKHGSLAMNRELVEHDGWDEDRIRHRAAKLFKNAVKIWSHPRDQEG